ncbi:hypothetical protein GCM10009623_18710 [Nocardioides aestuarii]|uniref:Uncharacterized protein n=1 Tax=Nocardioides aestuarii TaxID=252231 RepID=A0ABW4TKU1_9ACTN
MTDEQSPDDQEQVRRLLAEARHDGPMPDDVAARLDRVIADLADEPRRSATVVRLADRRRRAARMLVAAAAVVAVGVGGAQFVRGLGSSSQSESATAGSAADAPTAEDAAPQDSVGGAQSEVGGEPTRPYELRSQKFSRDAAALQAISGDVDAPDESSDSGKGAASSYADGSLRRATKQAVCTPGDWGRGGFFAVVYDGTPGWMVLRPPAGDTQVADLFLCGSEQAVRSVTLPVR